MSYACTYAHVNNIDMLLDLGIKLTENDFNLFLEGLYNKHTKIHDIDIEKILSKEAVYQVTKKNVIFSTSIGR